MSDEYRKGVIPKDDYMATIVHAEFRSRPSVLLLWWVVDTGIYIGHKISEEFPISEFGERRIQKMARRSKLSIIGSITEPSPVYPIQFISRRALISVDIKHIGDFTRNIITFHQVALSPPERNVIKPATTDHFYEQKTGKTLPLRR